VQKVEGSEILVEVERSGISTMSIPFVSRLKVPNFAVPENETRADNQLQEAAKGRQEPLLVESAIVIGIFGVPFFSYRMSLLLFSPCSYNFRSIAAHVNTVFAPRHIDKTKWLLSNYEAYLEMLDVDSARTPVA
jgi:hypothetical protein